MKPERDSEAVGRFIDAFNQRDVDRLVEMISRARDRTQLLSVLETQTRATLALVILAMARRLATLASSQGKGGSEPTA